MEHLLKVIYIDEAGGVEAPHSSAAATPLMVITGIVFDHYVLPSLTNDYLRIKARFYPGKVKGARHLLDYVLPEVKGSDTRSAVRAPSRNKRRHALGFLDNVAALLESTGAQLIGRIWVKGPEQAMDPRSSYTFAIQDIARHFQHLLATTSDSGIMVCDGRLHHQDAEVAHSIFTQKHKLSGDSYPRLIETPVFGRSSNHVGLQLADIVASALLFPMAARAYCCSLRPTPHTSPRFDELNRRYANQLKAMQYRYHDISLRKRGGIIVSDRLGHRSSKVLFS